MVKQGAKAKFCNVFGLILLKILSGAINFFLGESMGYQLPTLQAQIYVLGKCYFVNTLFCINNIHVETPTKGH